MRKAEKIVYKSIYNFKKGNYRRSSFYNLILRIVFAFEISGEVILEENVEFVHNGLGCVIHPKTIIKKNVSIYQNVTIGGNTKIINEVVKNIGAPLIQDGVTIYSGATVLGPITIGKGSVIGANSVITKDVPPNSLVYGNPSVITPLKYKVK